METIIKSNYANMNYNKAQAAKDALFEIIDIFDYDAISDNAYTLAQLVIFDVANVKALEPICDKYKQMLSEGEMPPALAQADGRDLFSILHAVRTTAKEFYNDGAVTLSEYDYRDTIQLLYHHILTTAWDYINAYLMHYKTA